MKKHICFAGFADSEIRTLRAAAANPLWECHFVADASAALALLSEHPLDALVANLTLPGKTGADLLREARESHPQILGFIVGGGRDQAQIINSIGGPHQFIRRPFDPAKLAATVKHGLSLDTWLATEGLHKLVPRLRRLPSLPSTYFNLLRELESDSVTTQNIGAITTNQKSSNDVPSWDDLRPYFPEWLTNSESKLWANGKPICESGGVYLIGRVGDPPTCSIGGPLHSINSPISPK